MNKTKKKRPYTVDKDVQRLGYILPVIVLLLILGPFFFIVPVILIPKLGYSAFGLCNLAFASAIIILILTSYYKSIFTPPGVVPVSWKPDLESGLESTETDSGDETPSTKVRFCQKCQHHKPERTHHCRVCDKCILKMDHHYPWINNCVGHKNHKNFLLFLIYASIGIFYALVIVVVCFVDSIRESRGPEDFVSIFGLTILGTILLPVGLGIVMLLSWQLWLVSSNMTSIENEEFEKITYTRKKEGKVYKPTNVYNLGFMANLRTVFGSHILWWWLPSGCPGDGLNFKRGYRGAATKV